MGHPDPSPIRAIRTTRQLPPILVPSLRARGSRPWHHVTSSQGERSAIRDPSNAEPSWPLLESVLLSLCPKGPLKRISNSAIRGQDVTSKAQGLINICNFSHILRTILLDIVDFLSPFGLFCISTLPFLEAFPMPYHNRTIRNKTQNHRRIPIPGNDSSSRFSGMDL